MAHRTFEAHELEGAERRDCVSCGKPLAFATYENASGKATRMPVSLETMQSHFLDCPDPQRFSKGRRV